MSRKFHSKRRKKRKFAGNQFTAEESQSTSTQSLGKSSKTKDGGEQLLSFQSVSEEKIESSVISKKSVKGFESLKLKALFRRSNKLLFAKVAREAHCFFARMAEWDWPVRRLFNA